jgi:hypothetical protein
MPTLVRKDGFRVVIYPHDHLPPHVHVLKQSAEIRIEINQLGSPNLLSISGDISDKDVQRSLNLVNEYQTILLNKWREIHG